MGFVNKAKAAVQTAAVVAGSVTGQPSASTQLGNHQDGRPTTSGKK